MRVEGRDVAVTGNLLQPLTRRTNDILRLALAALVLAAVITSSLVTRYEWVALERSVSQIVGVLSPATPIWSTSPTAWPSWCCRSRS